MKMNVLMTWFLAIASCTILAGQIQVPAASVPAPQAPLSSSQQHSQPEQAVPAMPEPEEALVIAKTALVVVEEPSAESGAKAEQALKKALIKWGRFQLVDDAAAADLIIVISDFSSSKRMKMDHVMESMAVFVRGNMPGENAVPIWSADETGPALGNKRPTERLVHDFRRDLTEFEKSVLAANPPSSVSPRIASPKNLP